METISTSTPLTEIKERADRQVFQFLSLLLQYPEEEWMKWDELGEVANSFPNLTVLMPFLDYIKETSTEQVAEAYVHTFDFNSKTALYLTYSKMGEERERGKWLVDLKQRYRDAGFEMTDEELSDYLPLVLEFISAAPFEEAKDLFALFQPAMEQLRTELNKLESPYAYVVEACLLAAQHHLDMEF